MPKVENEVERDEEFLEEEEEKKFPFWIIPLVLGPILLIVLIAVLASDQPAQTNSPKKEVFNENKLLDDGVRYEQRTGLLSLSGKPSIEFGSQQRDGVIRLVGKPAVAISQINPGLTVGHDQGMPRDDPFDGCFPAEVGNQVVEKLSIIKISPEQVL